MTMNPTLIIVDSYAQAKVAGMRGATNRHYASDHVRFWWPNCDIDHLRGIDWQLVVIDSNARLSHSMLNEILSMTKDRGAVLVTP